MTRNGNIRSTFTCAREGGREGRERKAKLLVVVVAGWQVEAKSVESAFTFKKFEQLKPELLSIQGQT